jgi:hypothetical protein
MLLCPLSFLSTPKRKRTSFKQIAIIKKTFIQNLNCQFWERELANRKISFFPLSENIKSCQLFVWSNQNNKRPLQHCFRIKRLIDLIYGEKRQHCLDPIPWPHVLERTWWEILPHFRTGPHWGVCTDHRVWIKFSPISTQSRLTWS